MYPVKQNTILDILFFAHDANGDAVTGMVDGGFTKRISKNGSAFSALTITITERENGWYHASLSASHADTLGILSLTFTNASCKQVNLQYRVEAKLNDDLNDIPATAVVSGGAIDTTGGAVDTVTGVTIKTGYILAATGLDAIVSTAVGMIEIAKAIWDRILSGGTHNIANSAGKRLRQIQEAGGYEGGFVWVDTVDGSGTGTVPFDDGTITSKCITFANAIIVAGNAALNIKQFSVSSDSIITLAATLNDRVMVGHGWTLILDSQDIAGLHVIDAEISGICSGSDWEFHDSRVTDLTADAGTLHNCSIMGTTTFTEAGQYHIHNCHAGNGGTDPIIDTGAAVSDVILLVHGWQGAMELQNLGAVGTDLANIAGDGKLTIDASCVDGVINLHGNWEVIGAAAFLIAGGTINYDDDTSNIQLILGDTNELQTDWADGGRLDTILDQVVTDIAALNDLSLAQVSAELATQLALLNDVSPAEVNAEMLDVLNIDTFAEPGQGVPPATASVVVKLGYLYKLMRNKIETTGTEINVYNDAGAVVDHKAAHSDDGTTYTRNEFGSGP